MKTHLMFYTYKLAQTTFTVEQKNITKLMAQIKTYLMFYARILVWTILTVERKIMSRYTNENPFEVLSLGVLLYYIR